MPVRRFSNRRTQPRNSSVLTSEELENRQLLSATAELQGVVQPDVRDHCSTFVVEMAAGYQRVCVSEVVGHSAHELKIEEIWEVDNELWVLSRLSATGVGAAVLTGVHDHTSVRSSIGAQRHFRIGGTGLDDSTEPLHGPHHDPEPVESPADFRSRLAGKSVRLIYGDVDPDLTAWRESIREKLIAEADARYGDLYGTETDLVYYPIRGVEVPFGRSVLAKTAVFETVTLDISDTNTQVAGVDEADIVETDGEFIYVISGQELVIVRANAQGDSSPEVVSRTSLDYQPQGMFLNGDRLTLISRELQYAYTHTHLIRPAFDFVFAPRSSRTAISVFDISDRNSPELSQDTVVDGTFVDARAIGDDVYVVVHYQGSPYLPTLATQYERRDEGGRRVYRYETRDEYIARLDRVIENSIPPSAYRRRPDGTLDRVRWLDGTTLDSEIGSVQGSQTNILRFNMRQTAPGPVDDLNIPVSSGWSSRIYASKNAFYILTQQYEQVESGGDFLRVEQSEVYTTIHKVDIAGDRMAFEGTGRVRGYINDQFSVDEHNGYLRIATTTGNLGNQTSENHLWILEDAGDALLIVGRVESLAPTEKIYSMRFDGDRAWMVTFRKVDPVFSFDLSDPLNPRVTGELKIPGYSDYLQLIDENHLLAIGRGTIDSGSPRFAWFQEVQVSLFNISDMENPTLLHRYSFEGGRSGRSEALIDHHAFNYIADRNMLAVPFNNPDSGSWIAGLITLHIDLENGITQLGDVDQPGNIRRSVRIADQLFGISEQYLSVLNLDATDQVIDEVELFDDSEPVRKHDDLLRRFLKRQNDIFVGRFHNRDRNADHIILGVGDIPENWNAALDDSQDGEAEYEFLIRDAATDKLWRVVSANGPLVQLVNPAGSPELSTEITEPLSELPDRISVQYRTRMTVSDSDAWSAWSNASVFDLTSDTPKVGPSVQLTPDDAILKWNEVAGRGDARYQSEPSLSSPTFDGSSVSHYEVYITDAISRERVLWNRNVPVTELDLAGLNPGRLWVWLRTAFTNGTFSDWSDGMTVTKLGRKLAITSDYGQTADSSPAIDWEELAGADGYEIEVTRADGITMVYSETNIAEARHQIRNSLEPDSYTVRVRARINGTYTEWSDRWNFTVVGRPNPVVSNENISWDRNGASHFEIWVNDRDSGERLWVERNWPEASVRNIGSLFGKVQGDVEVWVKAVLPDGSATKWSRRVVARIFAAAITVDRLDDFGHGETQQITWQPYEGVESVEIYVQEEGRPGAVYREAGISGTSHILRNALAAGRYIYWIRGLLTNGLWTRWGQHQSLIVTHRPNVAMSGETIGWTHGRQNVRSEIWINEINERGRTIRARAVHHTNVTGNRFSTEDLANGIYAVFVRTFDDDGTGVTASAWSERYWMNLSRPPGVSLDPFVGRSLDELLGVLDLI